LTSDSMIVQEFWGENILMSLYYIWQFTLIS